jgi:hypothetical protein
MDWGGRPRLKAPSGTCDTHMDVYGVNRRRGQATAGVVSNSLKAIKKGRPRWGHDRRRWGPHSDVNSVIRYKELLACVQRA